MATTYLQAINRVLEKIGETQISAATTSLTETYDLLVGSFVQDIKEQVEGAHNWRALRQTVTAVVAANAQSQPITEANERSRVVRIMQQNNPAPIPLVFDITDTNDPTPLIEIDLAELIYRDTMDDDVRNEPQYFALDNTSGDGLSVMVWPRPSADATIQLTLTIPQARFGPTDTDETIKVPIRPIIVGATWYALEERGEELGTNGLFNEERFRQALSDAVSLDDAEQGNVHELIPT